MVIAPEGCVKMERRKMAKAERWRCASPSVARALLKGVEISAHDGFGSASYTSKEFLLVITNGLLHSS